MTEQLPSVARADVDGNGPPKRTRRPALSCVECRMRKVKCDRNKPCGACIRIKSEKCTYRPARAGIRSTMAPSSEDQSSARSSPQPSQKPNELNSIVTRCTAPRTSGEHDQSKPKSLPAERTKLGLDTYTDTGASALVAVLLRENECLRDSVNKVAALEGDARPISDIITDVPGTFQKSKFFGQSHWMNAMEPYEALGDANTVVNSATDRVEVNKSTELYKTVNELKIIGRVLKTARMLLPTVSPEALNSLPSKPTCDALFNGYLRTFEGVFRVLHVPSFRKEYDDYWSGKAQSKPSVLLKIMLVCAIGVPFYTGIDQPQLRVACAKWIQAAENWLAAPHAKSRLNMAGLQIQILLLLAKQVCNIEGDHIWIPAGALLRTAMYLGLHRDPSYFGKINTFHAEMRRRLWATVLELTAQCSMDMGMPPMISVQDYDTKPPSNVNDDDLQEQDGSLLDVKPLEVCTDCSIQIAFVESLPIRFEIVRLINNLRFDLSYSDCLRLGKELTELCHAKTQFFRDAFSNGANVTPFQIKLLDSLVRRFILGLHRPYFAKAKDNPQYHFSRKICLDASLAISSPATAPVPDVDDDWTLLTYRAVGFFKALILYAISTIYYELNTQIEEQRDISNLTAPIVCNASFPQTFTLSSQSQTLYDALVSAHHTAVARLRNGETNAKGVVFFACAVARVEALVTGTDPEAAVLVAAKTSIAEMRRIMADVYEQEHGEPIDLSTPRTRETEHGRGEGADDVTGQSMPTGTGMGLDVGQGAGSDPISNPDNGFDMDFGIELQSFSPVDSMEFNSQFLQDPEWFFDTSGWTGVGNNLSLNGF